VDRVWSADREWVWLAVFAAALLLALFGAMRLRFRAGRINRACWTAWTLASLVIAASCLADVIGRLDRILTAPANLAAKTLLIGLVFVASYFFARGRRAGGNVEPTTTPSSTLDLRTRRRSWPLIVGNVLTAAWAASLFFRAVPPQPLATPTWPPTPEWARIEETEGVTDRGRSITLVVQSNASFTPPPLSREFGERFQDRVIQLSSPDNESNCHGWVFTGGRFGVASPHVDTILEDNDYQRVESPRKGDLVIYRAADGRALHSGVIRLAEDDLVLVESKWGPLARYLHRLQDPPYWTEKYAFYRSPRQGHHIGVRERNPAGVADQPRERSVGATWGRHSCLPGRHECLPHRENHSLFRVRQRDS
jgi:hypothetical protein